MCAHTSYTANFFSARSFAKKGVGWGPARPRSWLVGESKTPKPFSALHVQIQCLKRTYIYLLQQEAIVLHFNDKSSTLTCIWNESALNVSGCQNEMLGAWWKANKEDKVWSLDTVQNEIKPCMACQGCQLIFISKAHYSVTLQPTAYSSVLFNSSHWSPHLLSLVCQQWKKSVNWQMSVTNVNWCLYISGRCSLFCFLLDLLLA
jgi:hypothetical protein